MGLSVQEARGPWTLILFQQTANIPNEQEMNSPLKLSERNEAHGHFDFSPASLILYDT